MRPSDILKYKREQVIEIFKRFPLIQNPRIFGSVARGEDDEDSDIDFVFTAQRGVTYPMLGELHHQLTKLLGVEVDLLTDKQLIKMGNKEAFNEAIKL